MKIRFHLEDAWIAYLGLLSFTIALIYLGLKNQIMVLAYELGSLKNEQKSLALERGHKKMQLAKLQTKAELEHYAKKKPLLTSGL